MLVTNEVKRRVEEELARCIDVTKSTLGLSLEMPAIEYNVSGTTSGTAYHSDWIVKFNPTLLMENIEQFLRRTVPHEMAHLITGTLYPQTNISSNGRRRSPHGKEWKSVMRLLGAETSRCHEYDVSSVRKNKKSYTYHCSNCDGAVSLGVKRHNKQQLRGDAYSHKGCTDSKLIWVAHKNKSESVRLALV